MIFANILIHLSGGVLEENMAKSLLINSSFTSSIYRGKNVIKSFPFQVNGLPDIRGLRFFSRRQAVVRAQVSLLLLPQTEIRNRPNAIHASQRLHFSFNL